MYEINNKGSNRKKQSAVLTLILAALLLISGTFAWKDYRQHKSNVMSGKGATRDVVLIEEFNPKDGENWVAKDDSGNTGEIRKKVSVENKGQANVIVRLSLKEYMETDKSVASEISNLRYMIDSSGDYIKIKATPELEDDSALIAEKMNEKLAALPDIKNIVGELEDIDVADEDANDSDDDYRIHKLASFATDSEDDGGLYYYIATQAGDPNGQYGKHITFGKGSIDLDAEAKPENIITGGGNDDIKVRPDASINHHATNEDDPSMKEQCDLFEVINADRVNKVSEEHAAKYVDLGFNQENLEVDYNDANDYQEGKWVQHGDYFYYSILLEPGANTGTLLESLILKEQPKGAFIYQSHIDLEAVSYDEISDGKWDGLDVQTILPKLFENWSLGHEEVGNGEEDEIKTVELTDSQGKPMNFLVMFEEDDNLYLLSEGFISFGERDRTEYQPSDSYGSYEASNLKKFIDGWYNNNLSDESKDIVLDSERIGMDGPDEIDIYQGTPKDQRFPDFQTSVKYRNIVDSNTKAKQKAFAPTVSDINYSMNQKGLSMSDWNQSQGNSESGTTLAPWWTSSPGLDITSTAMIDATGIEQERDSEQLHVRIAMWVPKIKVRIK